jgi:GTP-binding protein Era
MTQRCGYIAIMGRPNAGKSSLLNTLVGQKIAGVSAKPQTTRNRILGIRIEGEAQLLFLDTPGIHRQQRRLTLNSMMNREAWSVLADADAVLYIIDVQSDELELDLDFLGGILKAYDGPVLIGLNKVDAVKKDRIILQRAAVLQMLEQLRQQLGESLKSQLKISHQDILLLSAKRRDALDPFLSKVSEFLPENAWLYPADDLTDRSQKFVSSELVREQAFRCLGAELPYHIAVRVDTIEFTESLVRVTAELIVGRSQHKAIVLGKGGQKIKEIGTKSRLSLEQHFGAKVYLDLQVIVDEDWVNDPRSIADYSELGSFE